MRKNVLEKYIVVTLLMIAVNASAARADWSWSMAIMSDEDPPWVDKYATNGASATASAKLGYDNTQDPWIYDAFVRFSTKATPGYPYQTA